MKKIIIIVLLSFITNLGLAQISFNKIYTFPYCYRNFTSNIFVKANQYFIIGEIIDSASVVDSPMILIVDSLGDVINKKVFKLDTNMIYRTYWTSIDPIFNGSNWLISGNYGTASSTEEVFLINIDSNLNIKWNSHIISELTPYIIPFVTKQLEDNNYISAGFMEVSPYFRRSFVIKADSIGNKEWLKYYDFNQGKSSLIYQMAYNSDSTSYIFSGITAPIENNDLSDGFIISTDTSGNVRWKQSYHKSWYDSQLLIKNDPSCDTVVIGLQTYALGNYDAANPYYIGNGDVRILKIHADNGNVIWEKNLNICKEKIMPARLLVQQNGDIVVCGYFSDYNGSDSAWAAKINKSGDLVWIKAYNYTAVNGGIQHFADVKETNDGGYVFNGTVSVFESSGNQACWVVKTDSMGNAPGSAFIEVGINETNAYTVDVKQLKVYPNPAKFFFSVEYDLSDSELTLILKITDISGKTIEERQLKNKRDIIAINCSQYAKGNYNCIIFEGQKIKQMAKFVIE